MFTFLRRGVTQAAKALLPIALIVPLSLISPSASSHHIEPVATADTKLQTEIDTMRKEFKDASTRRDAAALRNFYTDDFTHTHTSGKVDNKDARIVSVIAGEPTVEMAPLTEFKLSCFGDAVCIARALSPIKRSSDAKWFDVRWTQTFIRTSKGWQIAISQATGLPSTVRDSQ